MNFERFRTDPRSFGRLAHYTIPNGPDSKLFRDLLAGKPTIGCAGVSQETLAFYLCWRIACWPRSTTLVVTPHPDDVRLLFARAHAMMSKAEHELREEVLFGRDGASMSCAYSDVLGAVHCPSGILGTELPQTTEPLTFLIPDFHRIPRPHLSYASRWAARPHTFTILNSPPLKP